MRQIFEDIEETIAFRYWFFDMGILIVWSNDFIETGFHLIETVSVISFMYLVNAFPS